MSLARALLAPRHIALLGAPSDPTRLGARALRYLRRHGFPGTLSLVNPNAGEIAGERAHPSLAALPTTPDLAFLLMGSERCEAAIAACAERRVPAAIVLADGFAEAGAEGAARQARLLALARAGGVRLLGPNSMGLVVAGARVACSVNAALEAETLPAGRVALVSQSGSVTGAVLSRGAARGFGFSHLIGTGNEADLTSGEIASLLLDDPGVDVVLLFLEAIRDAPALAAAAAKAHALAKPLIALKLGRSAEAAELAASHTGALAGSDAAADAFFRAHGILRVTSLEALIEIAPLVAGRRAAPRHRAVGVLTTTGGGGALAVDALGLRGVSARPPDAAARTALEAAGITPRGRLLDMTLAGTRRDRVAAALGALRLAEDTDAAVAVIGSSAQFRPGDAVAGLLDAPGSKPVAAFLLPEAAASLRLLAEAGLAAFRTPESLADALAAFTAWTPPAPPAALPARADAVPPAPTEAEARALFAAFRLASPHGVLRDAEAPLPPGLAFPLALKALSPELAHRSEWGGVALGLPDEAALRAAASAMAARLAAERPRASLAGFLVQPMQQGLAEVLLGFRRDPEVGPVVLLGAGGIHAEIWRETVLRLAPVSVAEAAAMIAELRFLAPLAGHRGTPRGDLPALAEAIAAFSGLAALEGIAEAEINPLLVKREGEGVAVLDAWLVPVRG